MRSSVRTTTSINSTRALKCGGGIVISKIDVAVPLSNHGAYLKHSGARKAKEKLRIRAVV